jgi:oligogalacturonide transporter
MAQRPVKFRNLLAYGSNDFIGAGAMAVVSSWVLFFYTEICGLSPIEATSIFAIARILDAIASPLIGYVSDHFHRTRLGRIFGRRRFFILLAVPLLPCFALMWISGQSYWYYLATYVFFELVYAMEIIPYETLAAEMAPDFKTKAKFAGARILCGQTSAILAAGLPALTSTYGKSSADTYLYMGAIFAAIFSIVALAVFTFSWERPREEITRFETVEPVSPLRSLRKLYSDLWATLRIRAFRLHLGMYLGGYVSQDVFNAVFTYFIVFALLGTDVLAAKYLVIMYCAQLVSVAVFIPLCMRIHPAPSYRIAATFYAAGTMGFVALYALGLGHQWWVFLPLIVVGLGRGGLNYIPWSVYNYMADVDEIVTGRRREGAFAGVMTFVRKALQAAAVALVGIILQYGGFVQKAKAQSPAAIETIVLTLGLGTLVVLAFGFLVSRHFRLNRDTHAVLMEEIERFKVDPNPVPTPGRRAIVEDLSGWKYDELWGKGRK